MMKLIHWQTDRATAYWANQIRLPDNFPEALQYNGHRMYGETWLPKITGDELPDDCNHEDEGYWECSPCNIIKCFQEGQFLAGLALTVSWGGMARTQKQIYGESTTSDLEKIRMALYKSHQYLEADGNVQAAWESLTTQLKWGQVITSKVLHFLARSCDYEVNPPVPFDNAVTWQQIKPWFFTRIAFERRDGDFLLPETWWEENHTWNGYHRYMTAMVCWSMQKGWNTTTTEVSMFHALRGPDPTKNETSEKGG